MVTQSFDKFREKWYADFNYVDGFMFQASEFSDVSGAWAVSFTVWRGGEKNATINDVPLRFYRFENDGPQKKKIEEGVKVMGYPVVAANEWVRVNMKGVKTFDAPQTSNFVTVKQDGRGRLCEGALGYMNNNSNIVQQNTQMVGLYSSCFSGAHGLPILPANWNRVLALFCARKTITPNWINDKDEYSAPDASHPDYDQWVNDCHVYSLFQNSSNQSAMRDVEYKGKIWQINNQFFWSVPKTIADLADKHGFVALHADADTASESFMSQRLAEISLSPDAQQILDLANAMMINTFKWREAYAEENPKLHLHAWDAGYKQQKELWSTYDPQNWALFKKKWKVFEDRMREGVWKFGFLKPSVKLWRD